MPIPEPECVALKRLGAVHIAKLLAGKTRQEQLKFWQQRTERLMSHNNPNPPDTNSAALHCRQ